MGAGMDLPEETDPVLGETVTAWHKRGGMYKRIVDEDGIGDRIIVNQESHSVQNIYSLAFFLAMTFLVTFATGIGAYLTFTMNSDLARLVLIELGIALVLDFFIIRNVFIFFIAIFMRIIATSGFAFRTLSMGGNLMKDIHEMMKEVIVDADPNDTSLSELKDQYEVNDLDMEVIPEEGEEWNKTGEMMLPK